MANFSAAEGGGEQGGDGILAAVDGGGDACGVVRGAKALADAMHAPWQALHVETPSAARDGEPGQAAEALALAAQLGAAVAKIPAATVADGIDHHLSASPARHLVLGMRGRRRVPWARSLVDELARRRADLVFHLVPGEPAPPSARRRTERERTQVASYGYALAAVALTLLAAFILNRTLGVRSLSLLFLFPVIAAAARLGVKPAVLAALASTIGYNFLFVGAPFQFAPLAFQSWVMAAVMVLVALYTGALTATLRGRVALSDRSAQENASVAAFALKLTQVSDWTATAEAVCEQVTALLKVQTVVLREVSGKLEIAAAAPSAASFAPLDQIALEWAWSHGEPAGSGTAVLAEANWQFQPLKTSLGTLAVLGLASADGRDPVPADQAVLLSTLIAQAALAHERLRLEDLMRNS